MGCTRLCHCCVWCSSTCSEFNPLLAVVNLGSPQALLYTLVFAFRLGGNEHPFYMPTSDTYKPSVAKWAAYIIACSQAQ